MQKNIIERGRLQIKIRCVRIACWIPYATNTLSEYVILIAGLLQQWLHERASTLPFTYNVCLLVFYHTETEQVGSNGNTYNLHLDDDSFAVWLKQ